MSATKTHWKKYFNYDYLGTYSLPDGQDIIVTIKEIKKEMVIGQGGQKQECTVMYFSDADKPMVLNRTNSKVIAQIYKTPYVEQWIGKKIQLYAKAGIRAFGVVTDGLRVRDFIPKNLSNDESRLKEIKAQVRAKLSEYKGEDRSEIVSKAKEQQNSITGLTEVLNMMK